MRVELKWGLALGVGVAVWTLVVHALGFYTDDLASGKLADQLAIVLPVAAVALAIRERSREQPDSPLAFTRALRTGAGTGLASLPLTLGFMWVYHNYIHPGWLDALIAYERERMTAADASGLEIERVVEGLQRTGADGAQVISGTIGTIVLAAALAGVIWSVSRVARAGTRNAAVVR